MPRLSCFWLVFNGNFEIWSLYFWKYVINWWDGQRHVALNIEVWDSVVKVWKTCSLTMMVGTTKPSFWKLLDVNAATSCIASAVASDAIRSANYDKRWGSSEIIGEKEVRRNRRRADSKDGTRIWERHRRYNVDTTFSFLDLVSLFDLATRRWTGTEPMPR